jgi:hypothetical protein
LGVLGTDKFYFGVIAGVVVILYSLFVYPAILFEGSPVVDVVYTALDQFYELF